MTLRPASLSSSDTSNSSRRESGDAVLRDRPPASGSRRASTPRAAPATASSRTMKTDRRRVRRRARRAAPRSAARVLSMSKLTLSSSPTSAVPGEFDGASDAATLTKYVPSGTDVVSQTKIGSAQPAVQRLPRRFAFAAVQDVVLQSIVVLVVCLPDERLQSLLIDPAAERRRGTGLPAAGLRRRLRLAAAVRRVVFEAGNLQLACRERPLKDRAGGMHRDRRDLRPQVPRQVRRGDRRQHGQLRTARRQHRPPLQVARVRARDLFAVGVRVGASTTRSTFRRALAVLPVRVNTVTSPGAARRAPSDHAPARHRARIADIGLVVPRRAGGGGEREQLSRVAGGADDAARRLAKERRHLAGGRAREQRRARGIAADAEDLALGAGADEQAAAGLDQQIVRRVLARLPDRYPTARQAGCDRSPRRLAARGRARSPAWLTRARDRPSTTETAVISVETVGTGRAPGSGRGALGEPCSRRPAGRSPRPRRSSRRRRGARRESRGTASRAARTPCPTRRSGRRGPGDSVPAIEIAGRRKRERHDVGGVGLVEARALAVGRDLVDDALVAGRGKHVARAIDGERPDVLVVGIEKGLRRAVGGDLIDLAVGRRGRRTARRSGAGASACTSSSVASKNVDSLAVLARPSGPCPRCRCPPRACRRRPRPPSRETAPAFRRRASSTARGTPGRRCRSTGPRRPLQEVGLRRNGPERRGRRPTPTRRAAIASADGQATQARRADPSAAGSRPRSCEHA